MKKMTPKVVSGGRDPEEKRKIVEPEPPERELKGVEGERMRGKEARRERVKYVYLAGEGNTNMKDLLGGKGANLHEMHNIGLPVPPFFTITTDACRYYYAHNRTYPEILDAQVREGMQDLERKTGKRFGDPENPLLVSIRSGSKFSMPGMMDTVLDLGLNDRTVEGLARQTDERTAWDSYRRFITMFGSTVMGIPRDDFEKILDEVKKENNVKLDTELDTDALKEVVSKSKVLVRESIPKLPERIRQAESEGKDDAAALLTAAMKRIEKYNVKELPSDPEIQLQMAIDAVFSSWMNPRAKSYRNAEKIAHDLGTAVNVQVMIFGNTGNNGAAGVGFTRDVGTGENIPYGEFLPNSQGEDVVSGARTPLPVSAMKDWSPRIHREFEETCRTLERHYREVQDFEFTVDGSVVNPDGTRGKFFMLQTRNAKRTPEAALNIAVDMANENLITREEALMRFTPEQLDLLLHPRIDPNAKVQVIATGISASPGAASGIAVFNADDAETLKRGGKDVILIRPETNPDDVHGIRASVGVLTARGGKTSHAAVVTRGWGISCVVGCDELDIDLENETVTAAGETIEKGEYITIDGSDGRVIKGKAPMIEPQITPKLDELLSWADGERRLGARANADNPKDARIAREYGAEGVGLCRTEHMFFDPHRLDTVQEMILARTPGERKSALNRLLPMQREDFVGIFRAMEGQPVTIRLLDPPLHEFLPKAIEITDELTVLRVLQELPVNKRETYRDLVEEKMAVREPDERRQEVIREIMTTRDLSQMIQSREELLEKVRAMEEANPMMGFRGVRLGMIHPEISEMQVRAIFEAAVQVKKDGIDVKPEVMIPVVAHVNEMITMRKLADSVAHQVMSEKGVQIDYKVGTMIETPRACLIADQLADPNQGNAEFFSFGTNDLTQMGWGISRDDYGPFITPYVDRKVLPDDPFAVLDREGVGQLMRIAVEKGRSVRPDLKIGICGEHGGDPSSIEFCHQLGLDYVSASPFRVPIERLAAARAALEEREVEKKETR